MITKIEITGKKSINYIREHLFLGGKTLSNFLLTISLEKGKIFSIVPEYIDKQKLFNFETGGIYAVDEELLKKRPVLIPIRNDSRPFVIDLIEKYLSANQEHCCIFEEPVGQPDFPYVIESGIEYVSIRNEMYYYFDRENNSKEEIEKALVTSDGYYFLCALGKLEVEKRASFIPKKEISSDILEEFVEQIKAIIVKAYDGEGYLMWVRE